MSKFYSTFSFFQQFFNRSTKFFFNASRNHLRSVMRVLGLFSVLSSVPAFALPIIEQFSMSVTVKNPSTYQFGANDLHLTVHSDERAITVTAGQSALLKAPTISPTAHTVTVDWTTVPGSSIPFNSPVYFGLSVSNECCTTTLSIIDAYFTHDGLRLDPAGNISLPSLSFTGGIRSTPKWTVENVGIYEPGPTCRPNQPVACQPGPMIAEIWFQFQSDELPMLINMSTIDFVAITQTAQFDDQLPVSALNEALTGFGPASQPILLSAISAVPEPGTGILICTGLAGLLVTMRRCRRHIVVHNSNITV